ncbi:unnamed protein product [Oikopleura dioica]|uniref:Uncharacterized protein n=1 Tax=Oikopleura dioica TaxID=34765 RepID=E4XTC0_OIKDI|nr:unnamed protein product [Oikopleura dioica]
MNLNQHEESMAGERATQELPASTISSVVYHFIDVGNNKKVREDCNNNLKSEEFLYLMQSALVPTQFGTDTWKYK